MAGSRLFFSICLFRIIAGLRAAPLLAVALRGEAGLPLELLAEVLGGGEARPLRDLRHGKVSCIKEFLGMAHAQPGHVFGQGHADSGVEFAR